MDTNLLNFKQADFLGLPIHQQENIEYIFEFFNNFYQANLGLISATKPRGLHKDLLAKLKVLHRQVDFLLKWNLCSCQPLLYSRVFEYAQVLKDRFGEIQENSIGLWDNKVKSSVIGVLSMLIAEMNSVLPYLQKHIKNNLPSLVESLLEENWYAGQGILSYINRWKTMTEAARQNKPMFWPMQKGMVISDALFDGKYFEIYLEKENDCKKYLLTLGQLVTDATWGYFYGLDKKVPLSVRLSYLSGVFKHLILEYYDSFVLDFLLSKGDIAFLGKSKKKVYRRIKDLRKKLFRTSPGLIMEKVMRNLIVRLQYDFPEIGVQVLGSILDDVERKSDFIIVIQNKEKQINRLVTTLEEKNRSLNYFTGSSKSKKIGVQITISKNTSDIRRKQYQIKSVQARSLQLDDVVMVRLSGGSCKRIIRKFKNWRKHKTPGGPEGLWNIAIRSDLIVRVLQKTGINSFITSEVLTNFYKC